MHLAAERAGPQKPCASFTELSRRSAENDRFRQIDDLVQPARDAPVNHLPTHPARTSRAEMARPPFPAGTSERQIGTLLTLSVQARRDQLSDERLDAGPDLIADRTH